jgi:lysophospholipase L1-like esterase
VIAEIAGIVKETGASLSLPVVDIHAATANHPEFFWFDGLHPDGDGQQLIAKTLYDTFVQVRKSPPAE